MSELEVNLCSLSQSERIEVQNVTSETVAVNVSEGQSIDVLWGDKAQIDAYIALEYIRSGQKEIDDYVSTSLSEALEAKQDVISDLSNIRSGAALGATAVQAADLSSVALSGSYSDLLNKPNLAAVATSGAYSDLSGTPTIPTVNNAALTITQGGVSKGTFTANASSDVTIDLDSGGSGKADIDLSNVNDAGTSTGAGWAMPSSTYDDLTLGASGATYTAPANGYFCFYRMQYGSAGYSKLTNNTTGFISETRNTINNAGNGVWIMARKNDVIALEYDGATTVDQWRFYYAQGSESEAS